MRPPCELVVRYVLPAFRSLVAKELIEKHHFSQVDTAKKLGTTQAAVSQYLYSKRGDKRINQLESTDIVQSLASEIAQGLADEGISSVDAMSSFCKLCTTLRKQDIVCNMHKGYITLPEPCDICPKTQQ